MSKKKTGPRSFHSYRSGVRLRQACVGKHGKTFVRTGSPGLWTFMHEVPGSTKSAVFKDHTGQRVITSYAALTRR